MNEQEQREIARISQRILELLYDAWERHTRIGLVAQEEWDRNLFDAAVYSLETQQGLIKTIGSSYTFEITPSGISYAEKNNIVPKDKVERHWKIRQHIRAFLANQHKRYGGQGHTHYEKLAAGTPVKNSAEILGDLMLLMNWGEIIAVTSSSYQITNKGLINHPHAELYHQDEQVESRTLGSYSADVLIVWDPEIVHQDDYASLITALGDIVRSEGGIGVERIDHLGFGIPVSEGTLV